MKEYTFERCWTKIADGVERVTIEASSEKEALAKLKNIDSRYIDVEESVNKTKYAGDWEPT